MVCSWWPALAGCQAPRALEFGDTYFESVAGTESIANGVITALAQDQQGLIWIGTTEGVLIYDGYRLRHLRHDPLRPDSLADNYVRALLPLADGTMWVATQSAGISVHDPDSGQFTHLRPQTEDPQSLISSEPVVLALAPDGAVWIGTGGAGLDRWDPQTGKFRHHRHDPANPASLSNNTVRSLLFDRDGDLWIGTGNGLNRLRAGRQQFERIASDPDAPGSLSGNYVYSLFAAADGRIWIGTQSHGAAILDRHSLELRRLPAGADGLGHPWIDGFAEPQPGRIWVTSFGGGIDVLDSQDGRVLQRLRHDPAIPGSLALDRVVAPLRDRSGLIWIGTWGGGLQWHNPATASTFRSLRHSPSRSIGLSHSSVFSVLELGDGRIWLGTGGNGIDVLDLQRGVIGGHRADPGRAGALPDGTVRALAQDASGAIWVGTQQAGLLRFDPATGQFQPLAAALPDRRIRRILRCHSGRLLVGTQRGLVELDPADLSVRVLRRADGSELVAPIWSMAEDRLGNLWVSTPDALWWRPAGSETLRALTSGPQAVVPAAVTDLSLGHDGVLWTLGEGGLHRLLDWQDGLPRFQVWRADGVVLPTACGRELKIDQRGRLWTPRCMIDPAAAEMHAFGRAEGVEIGNVEMGASGSTAAGQLLFGGTRGLLLIEPEHFQRWTYKPPLLAAVEINGKLQSRAAWRERVLLQPGPGRLSVEFAALDYTAPQHLRYAYKLEGLDPDWIMTDASRRVASYNNLPPGDYQLKLRGSNRSGEWNPDWLSIPVRVLPAWWQTWWMKALGALLLAGLMSLGVAWRVARIRHKAARLEALVEARTLELSTAKEAAEAALTQLRATQRQLVEAEKMASLGQLVAGVAHEINTPIGIAVTAASHLDEVSRSHGARLEAGKLSRQDLGQWQATVTEASRLISGSLERASTLVRSFKQVAVDQSSAQRRRFMLGEFLHEVQIALQPSFQRSTHQLTIECPPQLEMDSYPGALFQILTNLVSNAVLHAFGNRHDGLMQIRVALVAEQVHLHFRDDGAGMEAEVLSRAFDPFFTTRRGSGGSGLGLHLVHNLTTQLLGGRIEVHSTPGSGTEFVLELPRIAPLVAPASSGPNETRD